MNTAIRYEAPMITLSQISTEGTELQDDVYASDLKDAELGDMFGVDYMDGVIPKRLERLKVVYKDEEGVAALHTIKEEADDDGTPCYRTLEELIWFSFK